MRIDFLAPSSWRIAPGRLRLHSISGKGSSSPLGILPVNAESVALLPGIPDPERSCQVACQHLRARSGPRKSSSALFDISSYRGLSYRSTRAREIRSLLK